MNMIYKDDTLYVDLSGEVGSREMSIMKERVFSVLNQYDVDNVVINVKSVFKLNRHMMNSFVNEYKKNYKGNILIDSN